VIRKPSVAGRAIKSVALLPALRLLSTEFGASSASNGGGEGGDDASASEDVPERLTLPENVRRAFFSSLSGGAPSPSLSNSVAGAAALPPFEAAAAAARARAARVASLIEQAVPIIALQFLSGPDGRPQRDARGRPVPAWPEVAEASLTFSSSLWRDENVQRAAVNVRIGRRGVTRLMAAAARGDCFRVESLLSFGGDASAASLPLCRHDSWIFTALSMAQQFDICHLPFSHRVSSSGSWSLCKFSTARHSGRHHHRQYIVSFTSLRRPVALCGGS
jgi:hypothetical protein